MAKHKDLTALDMHDLPGSKFTALSSIPSGAGEIPNANIADISEAGKVSGASFASLASIPSGAGIIPEPNIITTAWTDYSGTSVIAGWSSFTNQQIYYKKVGGVVFVSFNLTGTSNATNATFTLPHASSNTIDSDSVVRASDNGGAAVASLVVVAKGTSTADCRKNADGDVFTSSGTKTIIGQFWYEAIS